MSTSNATVRWILFFLSLFFVLPLALLWVVAYCGYGVLDRITHKPA